MKRILILLAAVALVITSCSPQTMIRMFDTIAEYNCIVSERVGGAEPCPEPPIPPSDPLSCRETLAGVDCYAADQPFGLQPGWLRAGPPDIDG